MGTKELLKIEPPELSFPFELGKQLSCSLRLFNKTQNRVAFKVKTTNPSKYYVRPNAGIVLPGSELQITVTMHGQREAPPGMQCKDKFMIQSAVATMDDSIRLFDNKGIHIQECKMAVVYHSPHRVPSSAPSGSTTARKLLHVNQSELQFLFELNKELSCSFQLSNMTENHVAFKVKTTSPNKYIVLPNMGLVLPKSTCSITVKMQSQNRVPPDMKCNDKFLIQSTVANSSTTANDITVDMFHNSEEFKLKVAYVFQSHRPSPNSMTSQERFSRNLPTFRRRNSNAPKVVPGHDRDKNNGRDVILGLITIGLFGIVVWYIIKMAIPMIGGAVIFMTMLLIKMVNKMVADSIEDWVLKALIYVFRRRLFGRIKKWIPMTKVESDHDGTALCRQVRDGL